ncbi:MAG: hypothetical protein ABDK87_03065 [Atribacterota bacterium]
MKIKFSWVVVLGTVCLFLSSGCQWFADNPMFPRAKVDITFQVLSENGGEVLTNQLGILSVTKVDQSNSESSSTEVTVSQEASTEITYSSGNTVATSTTITFARSARFTFNPRNAVGGRIEKCTIEYYDDKGNLIPALKRFLAIFVDIPADISKSATIVLEIFNKRVEDYYLSHSIIAGYAVVKFEGRDYAGHPITFKTSVPISVYFPEVDISTIGTTGGTCPRSFSCH